MPKVRFEIYSTERGKKLIDLGKKFSDELLRSVFDLDDKGHIWHN